MFNKNDPLIGSVTKVMQQNQAIRDAERAINEEFGIAGKRDLPFQFHAEYDALVEEMTKEALVGGQVKLDVNRNNRLDKQDFKMLRGMKKKPMSENPEETAKSVKTAADVQNSNKDMCEEPQAVNTAAKSDSSTAPKVAPQSTVTLKPLNKLGLPKLGGMTVAKKNMEEETVEEATLSAKAARAGEDIGKKGKMFAKIAKSAAERYGSEERGKKVAGAILKKMRAKAGMEESTKIDELYGAPTPGVSSAASQMSQYKSGFGGKTGAQSAGAAAERSIGQSMAAAQAKYAKPATPTFNPLTSTTVNTQGRVSAGTTPAPTGGPGRAPSGPGPAKPVGRGGGDVLRGAAANPKPGEDAMARTMAAQPKGNAGVQVKKPMATKAPTPGARSATPSTPTIRGPGGTTARMTGQGSNAVVKTGGQTYAGSVVKGLGGGAKIQNFRAGSGPLVGPGKKS